MIAIAQRYETKAQERSRAGGRGGGDSNFDSPMQVQDEDLRERPKGNRVDRRGVGAESRHHLGIIGLPRILKLPEVRGRRGGSANGGGTSYRRELEHPGELPVEVMERYRGQDGQEAALGFVVGGRVVMSDPGKKPFQREVKPQRFKRQEAEGVGAAPRRREVMVSRAGLG